MANSTVSEVVARPVRTFTQAAPALVITEFWDSFVNDLTEKQYGALVGLLTLLISLIMAAIENKLGAGFMRNVPPNDVQVVDG